MHDPLLVKDAHTCVPSCECRRRNRAIPDAVGKCEERYTGHEAILSVRKPVPTGGGRPGYQVPLYLFAPKQELRTAGDVLSGTFLYVWDNAIEAQRRRRRVHFGGVRASASLDADTAKSPSGMSCAQPGRN